MVMKGVKAGGLWIGRSCVVGSSGMSTVGSSNKMRGAGAILGGTISGSRASPHISLISVEVKEFTDSIDSVGLLLRVFALTFASASIIDC
jgi:hypothetical protein